MTKLTVVYRRCARKRALADSPVSGGKSGSVYRTGGTPTRHQLDEQESCENCEADLEEAKVDITEDSIMERSDDVDSTSITNLGDSVDKDTETDPGEESTLTGEEKVGRGGEADCEEEGGVPREGGVPGERGGTAGKGGDGKEVETIKIDRSPSLTASKECGQKTGELQGVHQDLTIAQDIQTSTSSHSSRFVCGPCLLLRHAHGEVETTCPRRPSKVP